LRSIVPDLATSWSWDEEGTELTFPLRQGVKWHDGKPFTAADVRCTFELMMDNAKEKLRLNPRKSWYANVAEVSTNGDYEATVHLKRPQPSFLALLATGWSPAGLTSTASSTRSSKMSRRGCYPSCPAKTTYFSGSRCRN